MPPTHPSTARVHVQRSAHTISKTAGVTILTSSCCLLFFFLTVVFAVLFGVEHSRQTIDANSLVSASAVVSAIQSSMGSGVLSQQGGDQATAGGDQATAGGDQATVGGDQATAGGDGDGDASAQRPGVASALGVGSNDEPSPTPYREDASSAPQCGGGGGRSTPLHALSLPPGATGFIDGGNVYANLPDDIGGVVHNYVENVTVELTRGKWPPDLLINCRCKDTDGSICSPFYMAAHGDTPATAGCLPNGCANCIQSVFVEKADGGRRLLDGVGVPHPSPDDLLRVEMLFFYARSRDAPASLLPRTTADDLAPITTMAEWNRLPWIDGDKARALNEILAPFASLAPESLWNAALKTKDGSKYLAALPYGALHVGQLFRAAHGDTVKCSGCDSPIQCVAASQGFIHYCAHSCGDSCTMTVDFSTPRARPPAVDLDVDLAVVERSVAPFGDASVAISPADPSRLELTYAEPYWPMDIDLRVYARAGEPIFVECNCLIPLSEDYFCLPFVQLSTATYGCMRSDCETCFRNLISGVSSWGASPLLDVFLRVTQAGERATDTPLPTGVRFVTDDDLQSTWNALPWFGEDEPTRDERAEARAALDRELRFGTGPRRAAPLIIERGGKSSRALARAPLDRFPRNAYRGATPLERAAIECSGRCAEYGLDYVCSLQQLNDLLFCDGCRSGCRMTFFQ